MGIKSAIIVGLVIGAIATLFIVEYMNLNIQILHSTGLVKSNIGVYWDNLCTNETTEINWGSLIPGDEKDVTVYIENIKNTSAVMSLDTENWNPSNAISYIHLSWNCSYSIVSYDIVPVSLTLQIDENIQDIKNFSFDIIITGNW